MNATTNAPGSSTLPGDIAETLAVHWPKQFTVPDDATPTEERIMQRALVSFGDKIRRLIGLGVDVEQIEVCLDAVANESGYRKMDRGAIIKRLYTLAPDRPVIATPPKRDRPADPVLSGRNPALHALRSSPDIEDAVELYPWFGQRVNDGTDRRRIDLALWRDLHGTFHRAGGAT